MSHLAWKNTVISQEELKDVAGQKGILASSCQCDLTLMNGGKWKSVQHFLYKFLADDFNPMQIIYNYN